jgi:hypothetical protein
MTMSAIIEKLFGWAYRNLGPSQVCWLCLAATVSIGWLVTTRYATADELAAMRNDIREQKGDGIAKRIFDYKVRLCDMAPDQRQTKRWLSEQLRSEVEKYQAVTGRRFEMPSCSDL